MYSVYRDIECIVCIVYITCIVYIACVVCIVCIVSPQVGPHKSVPTSNQRPVCVCIVCIVCILCIVC